MKPLRLMAEFEAFSLESFANHFRLLIEMAKGENNIYRHRKSGILKAYYEVELVITLNFNIPDPPHQFGLVFFRVPDRDLDRETVNVDPPNVGGFSVSNVALDREADRVLVISDGRQRSNNVVASGVPIRSGVGLMVPHDVPQSRIDPARAKQPVEVCWASGPGVIQPFSGPLGNYVSSGKDGLIKAMPSIIQCFGGLAPEVLWDMCFELDLLDILAGVRIKLDHDFCNITFEKRSDERVEFIGGALCPTNRLFGR